MIIDAYNATYAEDWVQESSTSGETNLADRNRETWTGV
jgi:hypothetical protein